LVVHAAANRCETDNGHTSFTGNSRGNPSSQEQNFRISTQTDKWWHVRTVLPTQVSVESRVVFADIGHCMDARTEPSPTSAPTALTPPTAPSPAAGGVVDVEAILREVEALAKIAVEPQVGESNPEPSIQESIVSEVSHLAPLSNDASTASTMQTTQDADATNGGVFDLGKLERELEALISASSGASSNTSSSASSSASSHTSVGEDAKVAPLSSALSSSTRALPSPQQVADASIEKEPIDPMLREIAAILDDTNDAMLRTSDGSMDRALDTVFDARALSGQEEDVNRALIEAFGTSRRPFGFNNPDGTQASVTNPIPRFEGISRALPPEMSGSPFAGNAVQPSGVPTEVPTSPRRFEEIAAQSIGREARPEYAGETPFEPAFPAVPITDTAPTLPSVQPTVPASSPHESGPKSLEKLVVSSAVDERGHADSGARSTEQIPPEVAVVAASSTASPNTSIEKSARTPLFATVATRVSAGLRMVATLPLHVCALPMRFVPTSFRSYVTVAALSMLIWAPVAWWMAQRSTHVPGVGRIDFSVSEADTHDGSQHTEADAAHGSTHSDANHGTDSAAQDSTAQGLTAEGSTAQATPAHAPSSAHANDHH
jgi:hypothetical protein